MGAVGGSEFEDPEPSRRLRAALNSLGFTIDETRQARTAKYTTKPKPSNVSYHPGQSMTRYRRRSHYGRHRRRDVEP